MEKRDNKDAAYNAAPQDWLDASNEGNWQLAEASEEDTVSLLTTDADDLDYPEPLYATGNDEDKEENEENEERDDEDDEDDNGDWGNVDPQSHPAHPGPPDPMDPSGPGSAV
jgi:hypothetical protein